jgi:hypothetical protein
VTAQGLAMAVYRPAQNTVIDGDRRRYTNMNETNRSPVACGERQVQTI